MCIADRASAALIALAFLADLGASSGWLSPEWVGLKPYILPVAVWQWGAILVATVAYRPFLAQGCLFYTSYAADDLPLSDFARPVIRINNHNSL